MTSTICSIQSLDKLTFGEVQMMLTRTVEEQKVLLVELDTLKMMEIADEETQTQYQLDNWDVLRGGKLEEWINKFLPHLSTPLPAIKKTRMSPNRVKYYARPTCGDCQGETVDDVFQGRVVCKTCGLIQSSSILLSDVDIGVFGIQKNPHLLNCTSVIHEYSRVVYFVSVLNVFQGVTQPTILSSDFHTLREKCMELCVGDRENVTPVIVRAAIHLLKLPKKHLRHSHTLAGKIGSCGAGLLQIDGGGVSTLIKGFRLIETAWDRKKDVIQKKYKRLSFFNYRFLLGKLIKLLKIGINPFPLELKTKSLQQNQEVLFNWVSRGLDFNSIIR